MPLRKAVRKAGQNNGQWKWDTGSARATASRAISPHWKQHRVLGNSHGGTRASGHHGHCGRANGVRRQWSLQLMMASLPSHPACVQHRYGLRPTEAAQWEGAGWKHSSVCGAEGTSGCDKGNHGPQKAEQPKLIKAVFLTLLNSKSMELNATGRKKKKSLARFKNVFIWNTNILEGILSLLFWYNYAFPRNQITACLSCRFSSFTLQEPGLTQPWDRWGLVAVSTPGVTDLLI